MLSTSFCPCQPNVHSALQWAQPPHCHNHVSHCAPLLRYTTAFQESQLAIMQQCWKPWSMLTWFLINSLNWLKLQNEIFPDKETASKPCGYLWGTVEVQLSLHWVGNGFWHDPFHEVTCSKHSHGVTAEEVPSSQPLHLRPNLNKSPLSSSCSFHLELPQAQHFPSCWMSAPEIAQAACTNFSLWEVTFTYQTHTIWGFWKIKNERQTRGLLKI